MPTFAVVVILALATFRFARLIALDSITVRWREALWSFAFREMRDDDPIRPGQREVEPVPRAAWRTYVYELFTCMHCLGVWMAIAVYCIWRWGTPTGRAVIAVAAIAGAQSALSSFTTKADE